MESGDSSEDYQPGKYVACMYDAEWYVGSIKVRFVEHSDVLVLFMKKIKNWFVFIACKITERWMLDSFPSYSLSDKSPTVQGSSARHYVLSQSDLNKIKTKYQQFLQSE